MYTARITREHRSAFIILLDRSGSMAEEITFAGALLTKADAVALMINNFIEELINRSRRERGVADYFDIGILGYGDDHVSSLISESGTFACPSQLSKDNVRVLSHTTRRTLPSGEQTLVETQQRQWIAPHASGNTPMYAALEEAERLIRMWCGQKANKESYPPVIINITDGEASDASPVELTEVCSRIKKTGTTDGHTLMFNVHLAPSDPEDYECIGFPGCGDLMPDIRYARMLYEMSSEVPECYNELIGSNRLGSHPPYRAMCYNCSPGELFGFLTIGSASMTLMI